MFPRMLLQDSSCPFSNGFLDPLLSACHNQHYKCPATLFFSVINIFFYCKTCLIILLSVCLIASEVYCFAVVLLGILFPNWYYFLTTHVNLYQFRLMQKKQFVTNLHRLNHQSRACGLVGSLLSFSSFCTRSKNTLSSFNSYSALCYSLHVLLGK